MTDGPDTSLACNWRTSVNYQPRLNGRQIDMLIMHYTAMDNAEWAIKHLCDVDSRVSCHYLIDEQGAITQMVAESERAWHAGISHWAGEDDLNSASIGIEICNLGHDQGYPDFPEIQMKAVIELSKDILARHDIPPRRVLGHSDIAPRRKKDPGEKFDWPLLAKNGIGHFVEPEPVGRDKGYTVKDEGPEITHLQQLLSEYGYLAGAGGRYTRETATVITAFQRHFRPAKIDGRADKSTIVTLEKLVAALGTHQ